MLIVGGAANVYLDLQTTTAVGNIAALSLVVALGVKRARRPVRETLALRGFPIGLLGPMTVLALTGSILVAEIGNLTQEVFPVPKTLQDMFYKILRADSASEFLKRAAILSLVAPVTEELAFRGLFQQGLTANYGTRKGIAITALCFGVFHLIPWQAFGATLIGVLLGIVVLRTGSIFAGMALHAIWNLLPLVAISVLRNVSLPGYEFHGEEIRHIPIATLIVAASVFGLTLRRFWMRTAPPGEGSPVAPWDQASPS
jgi:membrane protease YdiL (CAAX protease family)